MKNNILLLMLILIPAVLSSVTPLAALTAGTNSGNDLYFQEVETLNLITNYRFKADTQIIKQDDTGSEGKISRAEISYGKNENLDAQIMIAGETSQIDYIIEYNRFKINSYQVGGNTIYNSLYGYDNLRSGVNLLKANDYMLNLAFDYQYGFAGLHGNTNFNNQIKRNLIFSPEFKYFFSEKSYFNFKFDFSDLYINYENAENSLKNKYSFLQTKITYKRVWSSINSFQIEFHTISDSLNIDKTYNNNVATAGIFDRFAMSKKLMIDLGLKINVNKNYPFVISPSVDLFFIFKHFNIQIGYDRLYDYLNSFEIINKNKFYKFYKKSEPLLNHNFRMILYIYFTKNVTFNISSSYNQASNYPESFQDKDELFQLQLKDNIKYARINPELMIDLAGDLKLNLNYIYIPYKDPGKLSDLIVNTAETALIYDSKKIKSGLILKYQDINYFIDNKNNYTIIKPNIFMNIYLKIYLTETFGLMIKAENLTDKEIIKTPGYPEFEKIFNIGIIAEF